MEKSLVETLQRHGQEHILQHLEQLSQEQYHQLAGQLRSVDWEQLSRLTRDKGESEDWHEMARRAEPPPAFLLGDSNPVMPPSAAREAGRQALQSGRVGAILVAGGQGTRLGFHKSKGLYPIGPVSGRTLFQMHCDRILGICRRFQHSLPLSIMTSPATDLETRLYFENEDYCGLEKDQLTIFCQGTMPAVDAASGQVLLEAVDSLALSPDGHGGLIQALGRSGWLKELAERGVDILYYAQVDNPLVNLCDAELIGYHLLSRSQMTTQAVKKRTGSEKLGTLVSIDGKVQIIEYSDLPEDVAEQRESDGSLKFWAGNIAVHVFDRTFLQEAVDNQVGLPFHRARKKVPYVDVQGQHIEPSEPNAIKFERFVFDLLPLASRAIVVEGDAAEVFAPVKNSDGAGSDTPEQSKQALLAQHRRWIETAGSSIANNVRVEVSPRWALDADEVAQRLVPPVHFAADTFLG